MKASELADLDLVYAPQFGSAKDPVILAGLTFQDILRHDEVIISPIEFDKIEDKSKIQIVDVRTVREYEQGHYPEAVNIPLDDIRVRLDEFDKNKPIYVYCRAGYRAYLATRILKHNGINTTNITGGYQSMACALNLWSEMTRQILLINKW